MATSEPQRDATRAHDGFVPVLDQRLEYRLVSQAAANGGEPRPTLVLLHEGLGCVGMWRDAPETLARRTGCDVLAYSRAGYGGSSRAELPRRPDYMHVEGETVLPAVLEALRIHDPILIGHSDGASIALIYAGSGHRAQGLALLAPHVFNERESMEGVREAGRQYRDGRLREGLARHHGDGVDHTFYGWHDVWLDQAFGAWNIEAYLDRIDVPVLLIQGADDNYGTVAQLDAIEAGVRGETRRLWLDDCGHSPMREQPGPVISAIAAFVDRTRRRPVRATPHALGPRAEEHP